MHHHRINGGLFQKNDVAGECFCEVFGAHGMAAIFDDDGFLVIFLHMRQRLGQGTGLIERTDIWCVGHEAGLLVSGVGRFLSDWSAWCKACRLAVARISEAISGEESTCCLRISLRLSGLQSHTRFGHAAATASTSQLTIRSMPPAGAAIGNRLWPAYWRTVRSPANKAAATTKPNAAAIPILT